MQVQQINMIGSQSNQTAFALALERIRPSVLSARSIRVPVHAPFGGDDQLVTIPIKCASDQSFAFTVRSVTVRSVKEVNACVACRAERCQTVVVVHIDAGHTGNRPASHSDRCDLDIRIAESPLLHY